MAELLFPADKYRVDITERLRKVTKPTAERLIKVETIRTLKMQFISEKLAGMKNA